MAKKKYEIIIDLDNPTQNIIDNSEKYFSILADEVADFEYKNIDDGRESKVFKSVLLFNSKENLKLVYDELQKQGIVKAVEFKKGSIDMLGGPQKTVNVTNNITNNFISEVKEKIVSVKKEAANRKPFLQRSISEITVNQAIWIKIGHSWLKMLKRMSK